MLGRSSPDSMREYFNPRNNKDDVKVFAAVATSWDTYYPGAERGKNLHNIAIEGMKDIRIIDRQRAQQQIEASKVSVNGCIEIALQDMAASLGTSRVEFIRSAIDYVVRHLEVQA